MTELDRPGSGYLALGYIDAESPLISSAEMSPAERVERLRAVFHGYDLDCVFVASPTIGVGQMVAVTRAARLEGIVVRVYTHLSGILASRLTVQHVGKEGVALTLKPTRLSAGQRIVKRGMDLVLAGVGLIVVSPVLLVVALAIKGTSRGPVLFRQERVTEGGRTFWMYKFRTMTEATDRHIEQDPIDRSAAFFKLKSDPRLTKVGRRLRRWSIDELPQLFNVILGQMSLVGPRPLPAEQVSANIELLGPRHEVRAGITGWWQINGRADLDSEEAVRMDHFYIENWSPALDLYILLPDSRRPVHAQGRVLMRLAPEDHCDRAHRGRADPRASGSSGQQGSGRRGRGAPGRRSAGRLRVPHECPYDRGVAELPRAPSRRRGCATCPSRTACRWPGSCVGAVTCRPRR